MQVHKQRARSFRTLWQRARNDQSGATVVEFALIFPVFLAMIFGIFEVSMIFLKQMLLDNAVQAASREIMVGKTQSAVVAGNAADVEKAFRDTICNESFFFSGNNCSDLKIQVLIGDAEINANRNATGPINWTTSPPTITIGAGQTFSPLPTRNEDAVVRVYAPTQTLMARMNGIALNMENGWSVLVSGTAFRVEPFPAATP
jgi:Flp pilus assembly protein TadG